MGDEQECQLRRRKLSGNPSLPLNLEVGFQINEGNPETGTPSPSKPCPGTSRRSSSAALMDFKNKQMSFDIQVEECEEIEIIVESDDEDTEENGASGIERAVTPTPIQDFGANVDYTEGEPKSSNFLRVRAIQKDCYTDVSDADTEEEDDDKEE